ncbi:MAG: 16S rRNA (uracil(1498)-N(3))-methyltransferase [Kiritimatiellae bacterium]|nr:16S rRNA (uracil(1498)-N(3))-methyltransferase [Kiritimatiellia bacterium]
MHRCLIKPEDWDSHCVSLSDYEAHHLLNVLRISAGEQVAVFDGSGREAIAMVELEQGGEVVLHILDIIDATLPAVSITLLQAVPKGKRMDFVVEKGVELGVARFVPLTTSRGVVKATKTERWERVAISATKQCGLSKVPEITSVMTVMEALDQYAGDGLFLIGSLFDGAQPIRDILQQARADKVDKVTVLIGPEGDLTEAEMEQAIAKGGVPVSFGNLVLRVETAAIYAASVISYELG